jgi:hypothetical protein
VLKDHCVACGAPRAEAPGLVTLGDDGCYFHKQPETPGEVDDAIRAMFVSCVEAYRYGGDDPTIRRRLAELGHAGLCDNPLEGHPIVIRNHVRFALAEPGEATDVSRRVLSWFEQNWKDGRCTQPVTGNADKAVFAWRRSEKYRTALRYTLERLPPLLQVAAYRSPAAVHPWVLVEDGGRCTPIWLHDVLEKNGAVGIRWFSREEWTAHAEGAELPY